MGDIPSSQHGPAPLSRPAEASGYGLAWKPVGVALDPIRRSRASRPTLITQRGCKNPPRTSFKMESTLCLQRVNEVGGRPEGHEEGREAGLHCSTSPQGRLQLTLQCFC